MSTYQIKLANGGVTLIDEADREMIEAACPRWVRHTIKGYAYGRIKVRGKHNHTDSLHRLIMGFPDCQVDHINGDRLDNRRENLRLCNNTQNQGNRRKTTRPTSCKFKGVNRRRNDSKVRAVMKQRGKTVHLGTFVNEEDAARCYDIAAIGYFGEFARTNFPREQYESLAK